MKLHKNELKHLGLFYLVNFVYNSLFVLMAFLAFYLKNIGFSFFQIGLILSIYALSQLIFEIPTGAFADRFGRKSSVILGYVLAGISNILLSLTENFTIFLLLISIAGISYTFITGANVAWVIDNLKRKRKGKLSQVYFIRKQSISNFGLFVSGILGAFLVKSFGLDIIWFTTATGCFISAIILFFIQEHTTKNSSAKITILKQIKTTIKYSIKNKSILLLLIITLLVAIQISFTNQPLWQLFLENKGLDPYKFGFIFSSIAIIGIFSPYVSQTIIKRIENEKTFLILASIIKVVILLIVSIVFSWEFGALLYLLHIILIDMTYPIDQDLYQKFIPSKIRATAGSVKGMIASLGFGIFMPLAGLLADIIGPQMTIVSSFIALIPVLFLYNKLGSKS